MRFEVQAARDLGFRFLISQIFCVLVQGSLYPAVYEVGARRGAAEHGQVRWCHSPNRLLRNVLPDSIVGRSYASIGSRKHA